MSVSLAQILNKINSLPLVLGSHSGSELDVDSASNEHKATHYLTMLVYRSIEAKKAGVSTLYSSKIQQHKIVMNALVA